jgi:hypothetical protein
VSVPISPTIATDRTVPDRLRHAFRGVRFPIAVFVVWRLAQTAIVAWHRGPIFTSAFNYDGAHYLRILHQGYWHPRVVMPSHAFFPGLPWLAWPVHWLTGNDTLTATIVASGTAVAAFIALWGVTRAWVDERTARLGVVLFALFPSSIFLWAFYSEAMFIALGAGAVWADRRNRHWIASACFVGLSTTRSIGIVIPIVVVAVRIVRSRRIDRWAIGYLVAGSAGLLAVLFVMHQQVGDAFAFMKVQKDWGRTISWPWTSVIQGIQNLEPKRGTVMVPALIARNFDLWCVIIVIIAIMWLIVARRPKFPVESWLLGIAMIALPLCSSVLASFNRFTLANWVIYPAYASLLLRLPKRWRWLAITAIATVCILTAYSLIGRFVLRRFIG